MSASSNIKSVGKKLLVAVAFSQFVPTDVAPAARPVLSERVANPVLERTVEAIVNREFLVRNPLRPLRKETTVLTLHHTEEVNLSTVEWMMEKQLCNFATDTAGNRYEIVPENRIAAHSGSGLWGKINGLGKRLTAKVIRKNKNSKTQTITYSKMDAASLCHEATGYNSAGLTTNATESLKDFISEKKEKYPGLEVISHGSYSTQINPWSAGKPARGRKPDILFPWKALGLQRRPQDKELEEGRVVASPLFRSMYDLERAQPDVNPRTLFKIVYGDSNSQQTTNQKTPWDIAGSDYDKVSTIYKLPDGRMKRGNEISKVMGWKKVPNGTQVIPGVDYVAPINCPKKMPEEKKTACLAKQRTQVNFNNTARERVSGDVLYFEKGKLIHAQLPMAWDDKTTLYIRPDKSYHFGNETKPYGVADGTRALLGVTGLVQQPNNQVLILRGNLSPYLLGEKLIRTKLQ